MINLIPMLFLFSSGGNVVTNGGNVVSCPASVQSSIFSQNTAVLDLFEGQDRMAYHYDSLVSLRGMDFDEAFRTAIRWYYSRLPDDYSMMIEKYETMSSYVMFVEDLDPSYLNLGLQINSMSATRHSCAVNQAAFQYVYATDSTSQISILLSKKIWDTLETDQKVALLFHEIFEAMGYINAGECIFLEARARVGYILSDEALRASPKEWQQNSRLSCAK